MAKIIAVVNQKGGVGKTTTTVNITAALHELGKRVLLCDFDPQANATSGMGVDKNTASPNVYDLLVSDADPARAVVSTKYGDVLPSNKALAGAGIEMIGIEDRENLLKQALDGLADRYDFIFIDCPPSLELLTVNALCAAGSLLVFQTCLNVFGSVDLLPLTGVTFPFVSNGGSAMMSAWGLLAFLKATDTRENASFAIGRGPSRRLTEEARRRSEPVGDPFDPEMEEPHEED